MQGTIAVNNIRIYCFHGCLKEEAAIGGNYIVDVEISCDFEKASISDELSETIDYSAVTGIVIREMAIRSKLIEHAGRRVADSLCRELSISGEIKVKVTKLSPPINGQVGSVSIMVIRQPAG